MNLKKNYEKACNAYVDELCKKYDLDKDDSFWVAEQVGGILIIGDLSMSFLDIVYIIENDVKWETFLDWYEYISEYNGNALNLKNWCKNSVKIKSDSDFFYYLVNAGRIDTVLNNVFNQISSYVSNAVIMDYKEISDKREKFNFLMLNILGRIILNKIKKSPNRSSIPKISINDLKKYMESLDTNNK